MNVTGVSQGSTFFVTADSTGGAGGGGQFATAMLEALLRGNPTPIQESGLGDAGRALYRPADAKALSDVGREWIGATRKSDIDVNRAVDALAAIAGPDGKLGLDDVRAYLEQADPAMSASDIAVGWDKLTKGTGKPLTLDQVRVAVGDVVGRRATEASSRDDPDALKNALVAFLKEARKTPAERARDQVLKEHGLTEEAYEALPPDQKLEIDGEIVERVRLVMNVDQAKGTKENEQRAAQTAEAAVTAATIEKQQAAYPKVIGKTAGFLTPLTPGDIGGANAADVASISQVATI
jgi:hypothetical protein